jgi:cell pole-organizing protein PopZ
MIRDAVPKHMKTKSGMRKRTGPASAKAERKETRPPDSAREAIAEVLARVVATVQAQQAPAEAALKAAMESVGATKKAALQLLLEGAQAQAEIVRRLLLVDMRAVTGSLGSELGGLVVKAMQHTPVVIETLTAELSRWLGAPAGVKVQSESGPAPATETIAPEPAQPSKTSRPAEAQTLDTILTAIAEAYCSGQSGGEAAQILREHYPLAVASMQEYLAMDDFLVLMWLRQQPVLAALAAERGFTRFYAELKTAMLGIGNRE